MVISFRSDNARNYIEVKLGLLNEEQKKHMNYKIRMLEENDIDKIIKPVISEMDSKVKLEYDILSGNALANLWERKKPDMDEIRKLLISICEAVELLPEYLLSSDDLVINPAYMIRRDDGKLSLVYVPGYRVQLSIQIKTFLEYVMRIFDYSDFDKTVYLHDVYGIVTEDNFSLNKLIDKLCDSTYQFESGGYYLIEKASANDVELKKDYVKNADDEFKSKFEYADTKHDIVDDDISDNESSLRVQLLTIVANAVLLLALLIKLFIEDNQGEKIYYVGFVIILFVALIINMVLYNSRIEKCNSEEADFAMQNFEENISYSITHKMKNDTRI